MTIIKLANGLIRSKLTGSPFYSHYYVTRRCYFKCRMCSIWKYGDKNEEPGLDVIEKIADKMSRMNLINVVFTGGEPFIRKDLPEIVKIFTRKGINVRIQTTGAPNISDDMIKETISAGVKHMTVSLDTLDKAKQDEICQSKNLWDSAVRVIKLAIKSLPKGVVVVNTVVTRKNYAELPQIVKFVTSLGAFSSFVPVHLVKRPEIENPIRAFYDEFNFNESDIPELRKVYHELIDMKRDGYSIGSSTRFLKDSLETIISGNQKWKCDAGKYYFVVYPDGSVALCDDFPAKWNILDPTFIEKFRSLETKKEINKMIASCPGCIYGCWRETSYILSRPSVLFEQTKNFGKRLIFGTNNKKRIE